MRSEEVGKKTKKVAKKEKEPVKTKSEYVLAIERLKKKNKTLRQENGSSITKIIEQDSRIAFLEKKLDEAILLAAESAADADRFRKAGERAEAERDLADSVTNDLRLALDAERLKRMPCLAEGVTGPGEMDSDEGDAA